MPATKAKPRPDAAEKHIRVMLPEADHRAFRVLAAQAGESMFQHARRVLLEYVRAKPR